MQYNCIASHSPSSLASPPRYTLCDDVALLTVSKEIKFLEGILKWGRFGFLSFLLDYLAFAFSGLQIPQTCQWQLPSQYVATEVPSLAIDVLSFHSPLELTGESIYSFMLKMPFEETSFLSRLVYFFFPARFSNRVALKSFETV